MKIKRALLSVSDKGGIVALARELSKRGVEILSTGGTAKLLASEGVQIKEVAEITGFPEILDGRVKTLHPKLHGGLLAKRGDATHDQALATHGIEPIDLLVANLYPFEKTLQAGGSYEDCIENIDIGGPAMIRAAAKNHASVSVIIDEQDYDALLAEMDKNKGGTSTAFRKQKAQYAYARTASYDAAISNWLAGEIDNATPEWRAIAGKKKGSLRYGENPHQKAALYLWDEQANSIANAKQIQGKELSYNNINDADAAHALACEFDEKEPICVIVKHANPCGVAKGKTLKQAYQKALQCDPTSAFGGIIALNQKLDAETAAEIAKIFTEVIIAPDIDEQAKKLLAKKKNLRVLLTGAGKPPPQLEVRSINGAMLVQESDKKKINKKDLKIVSKRKPSEQELEDMIFAFTIAKHTKSNAIIYAKEAASVGIGAGQMSRIDSTKLATIKATLAAQALGKTQSLAEGAILASDAFFPFPDGIITAAQAGITAIIQPGGSLRDDEVIAAANTHNLAMVFTGIRHFKH